MSNRLGESLAGGPAGHVMWPLDCLWITCVNLSTTSSTLYPRLRNLCIISKSQLLKVIIRIINRSTLRRKYFEVLWKDTRKGVSEFKAIRVWWVPLRVFFLNWFDRSSFGLSRCMFIWCYSYTNGRGASLVVELVIPHFLIVSPPYDKIDT